MEEEEITPLHPEILRPDIPDSLRSCGMPYELDKSANRDSSNDKALSVPVKSVIFDVLQDGGRDEVIYRLAAGNFIPDFG